jgi:putative FmdB family regulatory protein
MPLYEYLCDSCGHRFESIQKFSDPPLDRCPKCGGGVRKLQSAPAFQFKGSGWYITDYARKAAANGKTDQTSGESADAKDSTEPAAKAETSTVSGSTETPAAKTPTASPAPASPAKPDSR